MNIDKRTFDALIQHSMSLYQLSSSDIEELKQQIKGDFDEWVIGLVFLLSKLSDMEQVLLASGKYETENLKEVNEKYKALEKGVFNILNAYLLVSGYKLAKNEINFIFALAKRLSVENKPKPATKELFNRIKNYPMTNGVLIADDVSKVAKNVINRVVTSVRSAIVSGDDIGDAAKRLSGSKELNYTDSSIASVLNDIQTIIRTARTHIASNVQAECYKILGSSKVVFVATLDNRTTLRCAMLSGTIYNIDENYPAPPLHYNCRSVIIPYFENLKTKRHGIADNTVLIDSKITFKEWFKNQSEAFKRRWLGSSRYELYAKGKYNLDQFIDLNGDKLTIQQLKEMDIRSFQEIFNL